MSGDLASETARQLQCAAQLRRSLEKADHDDWKSRSLLHLTLKFVSSTLTAVVIVLLVVDGWFAYDAFFRDDPGSAPPISASRADQPSYSGLRIVEDLGSFGGEVMISNPFERDITVLVTVDLYDGEQQVGEVSGDVTLKPESTSSVELSGVDGYAAYTDARVHLAGWPT